MKQIDRQTKNILRDDFFRHMINFLIDFIGNEHMSMSLTVCELCTKEIG